MPISLTSEAAVLDGYIDITEVDALYPWLQDHPETPVDVTDCTGAHTAVVQVLIACGASIQGAADTTDWRQYLLADRQFYAKKRT
ncbi:hypothetical protein [Donghicola eburneus]|uniref:hypothetical protein n=1 Tax=Donghicola eburneus TaxID=393278 RepID=UPI0008E9E181|nr:hypothetical protein [Donghicola eburneus]SFQ75551.1 hypothetical protein SAMN05421764_11626 [Donghicola eburneus]